MKKSNLISKVNWRQMLIHFLAMWFFIQSFFILSFLHDLRIDKIFTEEWKAESTDGTQITSALYWMYISPYVGLLVAFFISLSISIKRKWFWLNSVLVFILAFLLRRVQLDGWKYLKHIFLAPGQIFYHNPILYYLANVLPMFLIGFLLFFSRTTNKFIECSTLKIKGNNKLPNDGSV